MNLLKENIIVDHISHGGPGSGRYPKGSHIVNPKDYKDRSSSLERTKKETEAVKSVLSETSNLIPKGSDTKTHPNYDGLSDDYMRKVVSRKSLERQYADAMGESKTIKSKGNIAREVFQTTIATLSVAAAIAGLMQVHYSNKAARMEAKASTAPKTPKKKKK